MNNFTTSSAGGLSIVPDSADYPAALERFAVHTAAARQALHGLSARNREQKTGPLGPQPYYCLGCDVADGELRAKILMLAASPLYQLALLKLEGRRLALQCYFTQTFEEGAGAGPGGVIGTLLPRSMIKFDLTAARAHKMWHWVDADEPGYLPEAEAEKELLRLAEREHSVGLVFLQCLQDDILPEGEEYPANLRPHLLALLGVPAMRRVVMRKLFGARADGTLRREIVLIDDHLLTTAADLHWLQLC